MQQQLSDNLSYEPSGSTAILSEVVVVLGKKDIKDRKEAYNMLYVACREPIKQYFSVQWMHDLHHAEDLYQETFMRVWRCFLSQKMPVLETGDHVKNWLYKIARRVATDDYRRTKNIKFQPLPDSETYVQFTEPRKESMEEW